MLGSNPAFTQMTAQSNQSMKPAKKIHDARGKKPSTHDNQNEKHSKHHGRGLEPQHDIHYHRKAEAPRDKRRGHDDPGRNNERNRHDYPDHTQNKLRDSNQQRSSNKRRSPNGSRSPKSRVHGSEKESRDNQRTPIRDRNKDARNFDYQQLSTMSKTPKLSKEKRRRSPQSGYDGQPKQHSQTMSSMKTSPNKSQDTQLRGQLYNSPSSRARTDTKDYIPTSKKPMYTVSPYAKHTLATAEDPDVLREEGKSSNRSKKHQNQQARAHLQKRGDNNLDSDEGDYEEDEYHDENAPVDRENEDFDKQNQKHWIKRKPSITQSRSRSPFQKELDDEYLNREYQRICTNLFNDKLNIHDRLVLEEFYKKSLDILLHKCQNFSTVDSSAYFKFLVRTAKKNYLQYMKDYFIKLKQETYLRTHGHNESDLEIVEESDLNDVQ